MITVARPDHHGRSLAAWVLVGLMLVGAALICLSLPLAMKAMTVVGIGFVVVGLIAGKVLAMAGYGVVKDAHGFPQDAPDSAAPSIGIN